MGDWKLEFSKLLDYADMIKSSNLGTSCSVRTDNETVPGKYLFKYFYVCFAALRNGWLEGCRKIIGLDGCFLKGACRGELLVAVGKNGNQQMYPIAWAVVDQETKHSWSWFLSYFIDDLQLGDGYGITIMSDMQKLLLIYCPLLKEECVKDTFGKIGKRHGEVKKGEKHFGGVSKLDLRSLFSETSKCDVVENNMCETFNSWIAGRRHKSVISMLEDIRHKMMDRHGDMIKFADTWISDISPMARLILEENKEFGRKLRVNWNHDIGFEIQEGEYRHVVDLVKKICTCRLWQLRGIPCQHLICALYHIGQEPEDYVENWYRKDTFLRAYKYFLQPITNMAMWPETHNPPIEPPEVKSMPGRPARCRRKDKDEPRKKKWGKASKNGVKMTCSICHQVGHNKRSCKSVATGQPSQPSHFTTHPSHPSQYTPQSYVNQPSTQHSSSLCLETSRVATNKRKQLPYATNSSAVRKRTSNVGFGVYTNTQLGKQVINPGRASERVIAGGSEATLKDASQTNVDLGFRPPGLKWKGKNAMTGNQLQVMSQQKKLQIKRKWIP